MEKNMRAKLIGKVDRRYYSEYELECIDCGKHYFRQKVDYRTTPYCAWCQKRHDKEKKEERDKQKNQDQINKVLDNMRTDVMRYYSNCQLSFVNKECLLCTDNTFKSILQIIDKYRGLEV